MALITDKKAQSIKPTDAAIPHGGITGLTLTPLKTKGRGIWKLRYVSPTTGKRRAMGFGSYPAVSIAEATQKAGDARQLIAKGLDPLDIEKEKPPEIPTFETAARILHSELLPGWKDGTKHGDQWINTLSTYVFPHIGSRQIDTLTPRDFADALRKHWLDKADTLKRTKQRCHAVMGWAWAHGYVQSNPIDVIEHLLPKQGKTREHQPSMPWGKIPAFWKETLADYSLGEATCRRAFKFDHLCALNFDQG